MKLYELLVESSYAGINMQSSDGSMPAGNNGPWRDIDTPMRNTANWLKLFVFSFKQTKDEKFLKASGEAVKYLLSHKYLKNDIFVCRLNRGLKSNGLIGQAWILEGLIIYYKLTKEEWILTQILKTIKTHKFDKNKGLWYEMEIDGNPKRISLTFNQQLWFAAISSLIMHKDNEIKNRVTMFINKIEKYFWTYGDGIIGHFIIREKINEKIIDILTKTFSRKRRELAVGYHTFILYAFALFKSQGFRLPVIMNKKLSKPLQKCRSRQFKKLIKDNKFSYPYNAAGIELAYIFDVYKFNQDDMTDFLRIQFESHYDKNNKLLKLNTLDPNTLSARLYEATRINNIEIYE